ncbi:hypothetical protein PG984_002661 [Apiospora sp. TS-2023a]
MPEQTQKIQPWKAMTSMAEDDDPEHSNWKFDSGDPSTTDGASVSKPMDRNAKEQPSEQVVTTIGKAEAQQ